MSYNQSRSDGGDTRYRRTGRLAGYHQQQQQRSASGGYGKGGGSAASAPARPSAVDSSVSSASTFSSNRSFKKPGNAQGGQSRVILSPANHSVSKDAPLSPDCQNGSNVQSRSQVISEATNQTESYATSRSIRAIPKAPTSQSSTINSKTNEPSAPAKASTDASKAFAFQFGSLGPDLMKIPARTSSAPPNLDEQKRAQMHQSSLKQVPDPPSPVLKQDLPNKVMDNHSINKEAYAAAKEKRDVQVAHVPSPSPTQKLPGLPIRMPSVQTPYQHPQVPHPVHFGGPNMHLPPQNVSATPFQMPMPMALSMGNTPQIQQQMFLQGLQSHPMPHQGMMHQAQGMGFATPIGAQIHPQLGHMGVGVSPHHEQHGGKFGGQRKVTPVKITHPDTHEELRLDRRGDNYSDSKSAAAIHPNLPPRSQPVPSFAPRPVNYMQSSYNTNAMFPPVSVPLNSSPMTSNSQAPRFNFPAQGSQSGQVVNQSAHSSSLLIRPTAPSRSSSVSSSVPHERDSQYAISSGAPATAKVTVKPAAASEKLGSPQVVRSSGEVNISYPQKNMDSGSMSSSQQLKPGSVSGVSTSFAPPAASSGENAPVAKTETGLGGMVDESNPIEDHQKQTGKKESPRLANEDIGQVNQEPQISDSGLPSDQLTSETINPKEDPSLPPTNGLGEELVEESSTSDNSASDKPFSNVDRLVEDSTPVSSEISGFPLERIRDARGIDVGGDQNVTDKHTERSEISVEQPDSKCVELRNDLNESMSNCSAPGNGTAHGGMDGTSSECPGSEKVYVTGNLSPVSVRSADAQCSNVPSDHSFESNMTKNTTSRGKKKKKEILQKADAAGTTSDLYMAYKGPEKKKETATPSESSDASNPKQALVHGHQAVAESPKVVAQVKNEPEDWEDAVDVSSPNLGSADYAANAERGDDFKDSYESMEKKYSRDFLLKFADQYTSLPKGFEIMPDIADLLISANVGASHLGRDSYGSPGKVMDRQGSASRLDRRSGNMLVDDRWMKNPGSFGLGYGGNVGFRPGQGGNSGVLKNPRVQAPIISRAMQSVGPIGGMGRNSPEAAERWQRAANFQQKGLIPSPHTPLQVMHRAEKKYEVGKVADEEEAKQRQLKGILNKLTPQNFEKLFEQVKSVNIENIVTLKGVISQIFDKALMEPTFCEMYADFCQQLSSKLPDFTENGEKITFKRLLLNKCQEEFERGEREEDEASRAEEGEVKQTDVEREEKRLKARRRMLGNIRLIGELYKKRMLTEKIMHECIKELLGYSEDPDEENIEALCKLMSTIGEMIDQPKAKANIDAYFGKMTMLSNKQELSSRMRFMLKDSIDLRKNKWQQRRKVEGPKKIEEVHRDAAQERHTQTSRLTRGPSISSSMRKGPSDFGPRGSMLSSPGAQIGNYHGLPQGRGFGNQDARFEERSLYDGRTVPMPQRSLGGESITLGPQGGLGQGMSFRRPAVASSNASQSDISPASGDLSRAPAGLNGFGPHRPASPAAYGRSRSSSQEQGSSHGIRDSAGPALDSDMSLGASSGMRRQGVSSTENVLSEERLHDMSMAAIKEFYSARDEKEVGLCIRDLNSPGFHPTMISLWVTDSFERKDMERDLLAKLLINLVKSPDGTISEGQLVKGFESVLSTLEDAVNDAPRAAEFLGRILGKVVMEKVVPLAEIGRLIQEGGEEPGSIVELGLGGDVIGSAMETIKSETGEAAFDEIRRNSGLRPEEFKPREPNRSKILDKFTW